MESFKSYLCFWIMCGACYCFSICCLLLVQKDFLHPSFLEQSQNYSNQTCAYKVDTEFLFIRLFAARLYLGSTDFNRLWI
uniref:Uncharacterized protein n=1 Tax=Rhizophora mucronata TaxID=61149 RepID=A0A2P2JIZ2_RHIMU